MALVGLRISIFPSLATYLVINFILILLFLKKKIAKLLIYFSATSLQFYYGDEILRKKRRDVKTKLQQQAKLQPKKPLTHSQYGNYAPDIFDETFVREADYVNEDILSPLEHKEG